MAEGGTNGNLAAVLAGAAALLTAAGAALATAFPKIQAGRESRHRAKMELLEVERTLLRERVAYAEALGDLEGWGPEHATCRLLNRCRDALAIVDEQVYRWANPAFCSTLGFEPGTLDGQPWGPRVAPDSTEKVERARDRVMGGKPIEQFRCRMIRLQGETIRVISHSTPGPGAQLVRLELDR